MKALVHDGNGTIAIKERPKPEPVEPGDAIVRVTLSTICTSDLHIIHGAVPRALPNTVLGHEFVGVIEQVGENVTNLAPGDRVAVSCETFCGECFYCKRGWVNNCAQGGWELGCRLDGCQAEFVRVPYAEHTCSIIPDSVTDEDALFLGDIVATGQWGAEIAELERGCTVAVIGAGPVGLATMMCAKLAEPGRIIAIDIDAKRLALAQERGLADETMDASVMSLDAIETAVHNMTEGRGADAVVEAAGGSNTFEMAWRIARPNAVVVISAMYEGPQTLPLHEMYGKNLVFKTGGVDAANMNETMKLVEEGRINTICLVSKRYALNDILEAYRAFEAHEDGCLKMIITPWGER
ncbi:alcohol dehydrogenase [Slackia sp.]|uniref:alcohol dehydrogenase n=1 Tax=Slackia sp. TaxID=2049041 RepID=UPI002E79907F|nr:alcohol dehydrogenase [Slackia sp.]MEE0518706.1 alcohol dehydrogenase [Slackia sp.]